jgi:hypothetical protein
MDRGSHFGYYLTERPRRRATKHELSIRLEGPRATKARLPGATLRDLLDLILEGSRKALRLRVEGRSTAPGLPPAWLTEAAGFDVVALKEGSTVVDLAAPSIWEAAPSRFQQGDFFSEIDTSRSSLSLFEESFEEALRGKEDADLFDEALLRTFSDFSRLFSGGIERIEIMDRSARHPRSIELKPDRLERVEQLWRRTPPDQRVRIAGRLDTIRHSDQMFTLILESGEVLRGIAEGIDSGILAELFGQTVMVSGKAVFRPSGSVLRIEADLIEPAIGDLSLWSHVPVGLMGAIDRRTLSRPQGPRTGIHAILGRWPGDETDEEISQALDEIS